MRRFFWVSVILVIVVGGTYVWANRVDPSAVPPEQYHRMATEFRGRAFGDLPGIKKVEVKSLEGGPLRYIKYYASVAINRTSEAQAYYDSKRDTIFVVGEEACIEATLPEWLRPTFTHTLRHEYGHALLDDWLEGCGPASDDAGAEYFAYTDASGIDPSACPKGLKAVAEEYRALPEDTYGQPYYMQTFDEYMAESFARFIEGKHVPVATREFLSGFSGAPAGQ